MVDVTKIKVGDTVIAKGIVTSTKEYFSGVYISLDGKSPCSFLHRENIIEHIPKPVEVKVGTKFKVSPNSSIVSVSEIVDDTNVICWFRAIATNDIHGTSYELSSVQTYISRFGEQ